MRIELVGPPAAGKSTLAPQLARHLDGTLVDMAARRGESGEPLAPWRRRYLTVAGIAHHPQLTGALVASGAGTRRALLGALGTARRERVMRQLDQHQLVVVDEGPLHAVLWTLMFSSATPQFGTLGKLLSPPDAVVRVFAPHDDVATRIEFLGDRLFDGWSRHQILAGLARYERLCDGILATWSTPVVKVSSINLDIAAITKQLREVIPTR